MGSRGFVSITSLAVCLAGCAATRVASVGPLAGGHALVTLVVSEDRDVVARECRNVRAAGPVLGCQMSWTVRPAGAVPARVVKIVRYTDALPSELAFEIDAHELCHTVAALQLLGDPCHEGNGGMAQAADGNSFR